MKDMFGKFTLFLILTLTVVAWFGVPVMGAPPPGTVVAPSYTMPAPDPVVVTTAPGTAAITQVSSPDTGPPPASFSGTMIYSIPLKKLIPAGKGSIPIKSWNLDMPDTKLVLSGDGFGALFDGEIVLGGGPSISLVNTNSGLSGGVAYIFGKGLGFCPTLSMSMRFN